MGDYCYYCGNIAKYDIFDSGEYQYSACIDCYENEEKNGDEKDENDS